ncbi:hypothetical protein [Denitromonas halophila]|uniref:Uncharacterized protein n=1 Tax=Denitromonas halophila TaxID=1629404 RepID=A0A557R152_9RHOO|nr:hypothetical protein [Denitromonas halophila]TVO58888.1 hypothetical protein FHP91_04300 [Denitromonas halophila]
MLSLSGCASIQNAVDTVKAKLPAPAEQTDVSDTDTTTETAPVQAPAKRPIKPVRKPAAPPPAPTPSPPPPAPATPAPVTRLASRPTIAGPAWLAKCATLQSAGGAVRCDADSLLARPSATVQVFTRDPALAVKTSGGDITLRPGLPHRYRFFVLP